MYRLLDRRYKKNLKALYIVHPTIWIRMFYGLFRPFIRYRLRRSPGPVVPHTALSHASGTAVQSSMLN